MESAKIQTWSAEESFSGSDHPADGTFVPTSLESFPVVNVPVMEPPPPQTEVVETDVAFAIDPKILSSLRADPGIESEIARIVQSRVAEQVEKRYAELSKGWDLEAEERRKLGWEQGHLEGVKAGQDKMDQELAIAKQEVTRVREEMVKDFNDRFFARIDSLCGDFFLEKAKLMHEHEKIWVQASQHLLKRFQVGNSLRIGNALDQWISEVVKEFADKGKVRIYLSLNEFEEVSAELAGKTIGNRWELMSDAQLNPGQSRYECDGGGIFFSTTEGFRKIDAWVEAVNEST